MQTPSQKAFGLALLVGIAVYFWSIWTPKPQVGGVEEAAPSGVGLEAPPQAVALEAPPQAVALEAPPQAVALEAPPREEPGDCQGNITSIFRAGAQVVFQYEGTAEEVRVTWPGGEYRARTADTCTGTECRFTLPRPGMADVRIALDSCPPEPAP